MPTTETVSTSAINSTTVPPVVNPVKYDGSTRGLTEGVQRLEEPLAYANNSLRATSENHSETEESLDQNRQSRAAAPDFTTIRIPTYHHFLRSYTDEQWLYWRIIRSFNSFCL